MDGMDGGLARVVYQYQSVRVSESEGNGMENGVLAYPDVD
jgi:hypothetical protein